MGYVPEAGPVPQQIEIIKEIVKSEGKPLRSRREREKALRMRMQRTEPAALGATRSEVERTVAIDMSRTTIKK